MTVNRETRSLAGLTAAVVTTAVFGKLFVPFYLIGSTVIFSATCALGVVLVLFGWRAIYDRANKITEITLLLGALYGLVIINFVVFSQPTVPTTYLLGILIFRGLFMIFGFAAAQALNVVLMMLLGAAVVYSVMTVRYVARFGDLMKNGYINDVFGVGDPVIFISFHQNIGIVLGLASLAAVGFASSRIRQLVLGGTLLLVLVFMFSISARGALVALVCSLIFLAGAGLWVHSRKLALLVVIGVIVAATIASGLLYRRALYDKTYDPSPDVISRTIKEIQLPNPGLRLPIWAAALQRISAEPERLVFGRGIGMYPVIEGYGVPDWLLHRTEAAKHYPHNVYLEMLYETGIAGLLLFSIVTLLPLGIALKHWRSFSLAQKSAVSMYVFQLASAQFSGSFAFDYPGQFFFALTVGIIASKRANEMSVSDQYSPKELNASFSR